MKGSATRGNEPFSIAIGSQGEVEVQIEIGSDVWVGGGALILAGVRIGSRAVIGAGSVVTRDIPEGAFAAGNPRSARLFACEGVLLAGSR